jgi:DNA-binding MarR family transcriptional regulator
MEKPIVKISASQVLNDIRAGMDDQSLMEKYHITYRQLQTLFRKIIQAGYVKPLELAHRLCVTESQVTDALELVDSKKLKEPE